MMKRLSFIFGLTLTLVLIATPAQTLFSKEMPVVENPTESALLNETKTMITVKTNLGTIEIELDAEKAPSTVANFLSYIETDFFNDTIFHRVIPGFMIQGGGFNADMQQKPTQAPVQNEANNGLENLTGTIAMARTPDPHSATAQFFINLKDNDFLNFSSETSQGWGYAVFGKVTGGMDVVEKIAKVKTGNRGPHGDVPVETVLIESVSVQ